MIKRDFTTHPCPWPECPKRVERWRWGCGKHWYALPEKIRLEITSAWKGGRGEHSEAHKAALILAMGWIKAHLESATPVDRRYTEE